MNKAKGESFTAKYKPVFDDKRDEWILQVPANDVTQKMDNHYEIILPFYASRALAIGGNILRNRRKVYREWLLNEQDGKCAICGKGYIPGNPWNLDHQPQLNDPDSKFIDYDRNTQNRVIHQQCDPDQTKKKRS